MEFKFRSINEGSSTYFSSQSTSSFITNQSITARFEALEREIERQRIRGDILAEEIRRRDLEDEVRRELMIQRENFLRFGSMRVDPRAPFLRNFDDPDRSRVGLSIHHQTRLQASESMPFQRAPGVTLREIKGNAQEINSKDKVTILAKPTLNAAELKRKATPPPGGADLELKYVSTKKQKTKDDWSCALCHISATSEQGLNEHLQGKKHKARERGLVTQKLGVGVYPSPKVIANTSKLNKVPEITTAKISKKNNNGKVGSKSSTIVENQMQPGTEKLAKPKKFRYWCKVCKVGAYSRKVMNCHTRGKRHQTNFQESNQLGNPVPEVVTAIKQETVVEEVESKEGRVDNDLPVTEDKDKLLESVSGGVTEQESD